MHNYSYFKLDLLAQKWAVCEKFRGYLWGATFTVFKYSNTLQHLNLAKLGATEQQWVEELAAYNFSVRYWPAKRECQCRCPISVTSGYCRPRRPGDAMGSSDLRFTCRGCPRTAGNNCHKCETTVTCP
ncbi:Pol polyprotein [Elysia marginata]|uniref:Pol polyprotein n=1 Tax=Elysia marginata TaxID=1093978 RepID=A0AAV4J1R0_9GAST|nr:Pol polyprotein [Elysia marginata]